MKKLLRTTLFFLLLNAPLLRAQSVGDTIFVQGFNYNSTTRDTVIQFPTDPGLTYEKVIMLYSMRCKDGLVSTGSDRNKGCGEWDYSCNTYLTDSSHVDSITATHPNYIISGYSGSVYNYVNQPTYRMYQIVQQQVSVTSITTEDTASIGTGTTTLSNALNTALLSGKSQFLINASELQAAGLQAGTIDALALLLQNNPQYAKMFRVRVKQTAQTALSASTPDLNGFTEVYFKNTSFTTGLNRFQFYAPFTWNGTDNILVELSFTNKTGSSAMVFTADSLSATQGIYAAGDIRFNFNGGNYIAATNYKGVLGGASRTIEAWIKTTGTELDIVYFGKNVSGQKYRFWINGSGQLRTEVNSGFAVGTTPVNDGQWHHVAMVQNGSNTNQISFYIDGAQDNISSVGALTINTQPDWDVNVGRSIHGKYFKGTIADVRMWSTALSQANIQAWRYKILDANHPNVNNLELYYPLNDDASVVLDQSGQGRNGSIYNGAQWSTIYGIDHFKGWKASPKRPVLNLYQGTYVLAVTPDTIVDSIANPTNLVTQYQVFPKTGTLVQDSIGPINQTSYWEAQADSLFNPLGNLIGVFNNPPDGSITISGLNYWRRFPSKFEIMSFVTPYGINLDLGMGGKTWAFDLTDFSPILKGKKRINMEWGGQWQEDIDIQFLCIVGTPPRNVLDIQQIWRVSKESYARIASNAAFEARDVPLNPNASGFKIRSAITGHGQEGEFIPRTHNINVNGGSVDFSWQAWKECALNPVYPQGGTWIYDRAGWCPGMATDLQEFEITPLVSAGQTANLDYSMSAATGTSDYIVNHQLVTYGPPNFTTDAAVVDIINPTDKIEHQRSGSICNGPIVRIKNTGSDLLTSLTLTYWVNNNPNPEVYTWSGTLGFLETEDVNLPVGALWDGLVGTGVNVFHVTVDQPNGTADGYAYNNAMHTPFALPEVFPNKIYFMFRTNNAAFENNYNVKDAWGNTILSRSAFTNNNIYYDTLELPDGCYTIKLNDTGDDGISFWANNDGNGYFRIFDAQTSTRIYTLEPDFGKSSSLAFTVNYPLSFEELHKESTMTVYPNPNNGRFNIEASAEKSVHWALQVTSLDGKLIWQNTYAKSSTLNQDVHLPQLAPGMYLLQVISGENIEVKKLIIK